MGVRSVHIRLTSSAGVLAIALAVVASLMPGLVAAPSHAREVPPPGACYEYNYNASLGRFAPRAEPISCRGPHTARTIRIGQFPQEAEWTDRLKFGDLVFATCEPAFWELLGGTPAERAVSVYGWVYFAPTITEWNHGERWFRCDATLVVQGRRTETLHQLPTRTPYLANGISRVERLCATVSRTETSIASCADPHNIVAVGSFRMPGRTMPGVRAFRRAAERRCPRITGTRTWFAQFPSSREWKLDSRQVACFKPELRR